jgi:hypothetical protein
VNPRHVLIRLAMLWVSLGCAAAEGDLDELELGTPMFDRDARLDVANASAPGERRSHNTGENCVGCHQAYGPGRGQFTVAGSIANAEGDWLSNPIVELWSAPEDEGGEIVLRIEGDERGNVFTTESLPFPERALFVSVRERDSNLRTKMPFPIINGSCNHCHAGNFRVKLGEHDHDEPEHAAAEHIETEDSEAEPGAADDSSSPSLQGIGADLDSP